MSGRNTSAGEAPRGVVRAAEERVDGTCSRADVEAYDRAGGVVGIGEGGGGRAGVEEVLDPKEVVEAVWDLGLVSMAGLGGKGGLTAGHSLSGGRLSFRPKSRFRRDLVSCWTDSGSLKSTWSFGFRLGERRFSTGKV